MRARWRTIVVVAALVAAVFVSSPLHLPLNNPNEGVRVFTVKALVEQHTLAINDVVAAWGYIDDKAVIDGRLYQSKAPFVALVAAAAYAVVVVVSGPLDRVDLTRLCRVAGGVVPFALALAAAWWALRRARRSDPDDIDTDDDLLVDVVVVAFIVGSGVLASLHVFSGHALAAVAPLTVLAIARLPRLTARHFVIVGAVLSAATCAEYPAVLSFPLALLAIRRSAEPRRAIMIVVVSAFVVALPTMAAHTAMFGAPWRTGYSFLESSDYRPLVAGTFFGIGLPDFRVLGTVLFSPAIGLFFGSPLLVLGVLGIWQRRRRGRDDVVDTVIVVCVIAAYLWFIAGFRGWRGGWSVGPRYVLELVGLLSAFVVDGARLLPSRMRHGVVFSLVGIGVAHSGLPGAFFPHLPDVLQQPIGELLLPLIARGFAPDSVPLWLGLSSSTSAAVIVAVLFLAVVVIGLVHRRPVAMIAVVIAAPIAWLELQTAPTPRAALETRRITDNWRPERGNPYAVDVVTAPEATAFAIDRGRRLRQHQLRCVDQTRPRRRDVGPFSDVLAEAQGHALASPALKILVVDDALADHIGAAGGAALTLTFSDLQQRGSLPVPCSGEIGVVIGQRPLPRALVGLRPSGDDVDLGDGFRLRRLQRPTP